MKIHFSARAKGRARALARWWRDNRPGAPSLFDDELEGVCQILAANPRVGGTYPSKRRDVIYRVLLRRTEQYVYYTVDDDAQVVLLLTIWGVRRRRGPKL